MPIFARLIAIMLLLTAHSVELSALTSESSTQTGIAKSGSGLQSIDFSPWHQNGLGLLGSEVDLKAQAVDLLRHQFQVPAQIEIIPLAPISNPIGSENIDFGFRFAGRSFCEVMVRAHKVKGLQPSISGSAPSRFLELRELEFDQSKLNQALDALNAALNERGIDQSPMSLRISNECVATIQYEISEAWQIEFLANGTPFRATIAPFRVLSLDPLSFHIARTGNATVYPRNEMNNAQMQSFDLPAMSDSGELTSDFFKTQPCRQSRVASSNSVYAPMYRSNAYAEVAVFTHANQMRKFYQSIGLVETTPPQILLVLHDYFLSSSIADPCVVSSNNSDASPNQALYVPAFGSSPPRIALGDGDGYGLKDLPLEADVVSHEYGHHVIFRVMTSTSGESLVLHEGLADVFVMLKNDDYCFAPSICPANSTGCYVKGQCLRTAGHTMSFGDAKLPSLAHQRGQIISAMFWDLREDSNIGSDAADRIEIVRRLAFGGIERLKKSSTFKDLVSGLTNADLALYDGKYSCRIFAAATKRGLITSSEDLCLNPAAASPDTEVPVGETESTGSVEKTSGEEGPAPSPTPFGNKSSSDSSPCGVIGGAKSSSSALIWLLVGFIPALLRSRKMRTS
jgi:hypothetical protein